MAEGKNTVYVGSDTPEGYDLFIDPEGDGLEVDNTATENSNNLITSGAVYAAMQEAKETAQGAKEIYIGSDEPPADAVFQIDFDGEVVKYMPVDKTEDMTAPVGVDENG